MSRKTHLFCDRLLWVLFLGVSIIGRKLLLLVRIQEAIAANQGDQLSDHPLTQALLAQLRQE